MRRLRTPALSPLPGCVAHRHQLWPMREIEVRFRDEPSDEAGQAAVAVGKRLPDFDFVLPPHPQWPFRVRPDEEGVG